MGEVADMDPCSAGVVDRSPLSAVLRSSPPLTCPAPTRRVRGCLACAYAQVKPLAPRASSADNVPLRGTASVLPRPQASCVTQNFRIPK